MQCVETVLNNVDLRMAKIEDLPFVLDVQERAMSPETIKVHGHWDHDLQRENTNESTISFYEIISFNRKKIGALQVFVQEDHLEFRRIYILPEEQSKGYGSLAIKKIMDRSKKLGRCKIHFKVYKTNDRAIDLYKSLGCKIVKELEQHFEMEHIL